MDAASGSGPAKLGSPSPSLFRPGKRIEAGVLRENRKLLESVERRGVLRGSLSLGALMMLGGCDITNDRSVQGVLQAVSAWNDRVQGWLFSPNRLAPTYTEAEVLKPPRFNAFYDVEMVKPVDAGTWRLGLAGLVGDKRPWTARQIAELPEQEIIIRHICVEGWDYIGQWSGPNLRLFLERVGADLTAKYVHFRCADGYSSSITRVPAVCVKRKNPINTPLFASRPPGLENLNPYATIIAEEALRRGIRVEVTDPEWGEMRLTLGGRSVLTRESLSEFTTAVAMSRCDDKRVTRRIMRRAGVRVARGALAADGDLEEARALLRDVDAVVVKPARGEQGRGSRSG